MAPPMIAPAEKRGHDAEREDRHAGISAAIGLQNPCESQTGDICREGDGEIEATGDQRHEHGERQQAEFGKLERDRREGLRAEEAIGRQAEQQNDRRENHEQAGDLAPGRRRCAGCARLLAKQKRRDGGHWVAPASFGPLSRRVTRPIVSPETLMATRMTAPTIMRKA